MHLIVLLAADLLAPRLTEFAPLLRPGPMHQSILRSARRVLCRPVLFSPIFRPVRGRIERGWSRV
jgi:hypothetical protein